MSLMKEKSTKQIYSTNITETYYLMVKIVNHRQRPPDELDSTQYQFTVSIHIYRYKTHFSFHNKSNGCILREI